MTDQANPEPLATPSEVAEYLRIPEKTLVEWRSRGKGPAWRKVGKHVRYRWADVEKWLDAQPGGDGNDAYRINQKETHQ